MKFIKLILFPIIFAFLIFMFIVISTAFEISILFGTILSVLLLVTLYGFYTLSKKISNKFSTNDSINENPNTMNIDETAETHSTHVQEESDTSINSTFSTELQSDNNTETISEPVQTPIINECESSSNNILSSTLNSSAGNIETQTTSNNSIDCEPVHVTSTSTTAIPNREITEADIEAYIDSSVSFGLPNGRYVSARDETTREYKPDPLITAVKYTKRHKFDDKFVAFDFETTGFNYKKEDIIQIGAARFEGDFLIETFSTFVKPSKKIPKAASSVNGITDDMVADAPTIDEVLPAFCEFIGKSTLVAHNASFDMKFLLKSVYFYNENNPDNQLKVKNRVFDTLKASRKYMPQMPNHKLPTLVKKLNIKCEQSHSALPDALAVGEVYMICRDESEYNE
jgi:DNA polymerase III epsilon subunit family exonuclease